MNPKTQSILKKERTGNEFFFQWRILITPILEYRQVINKLSEKDISNLLKCFFKLLQAGIHLIHLSCELSKLSILMCLVFSFINDVMQVWRFSVTPPTSATLNCLFTFINSVTEVLIPPPPIYCRDTLLSFTLLDTDLRDGLDIQKCQTNYNTGDFFRAFYFCCVYNLLEIYLFLFFIYRYVAFLWKTKKS